MAGILIKQLGTVMILQVEGELTFAEAAEALTGFYPHTICHVLWDLTDCSRVDISVDQYKELLVVAQKNMAGRANGKTAYIIPNENMYEALKKLITLTESIQMPHTYKFFKEYEQGLEWLSEES